MRCPNLNNLPPPPLGRTGWPWTQEGWQLPDTMANGQPWPLVSIVTPSYNQGHFIEETIRSVLLQGYPNLEYIVIDGGSTDDTLPILRRYEGIENLVWLSQPDGGMYDAINKGLHLSHGDILAYLNSDDRYFPWTIASIVQALSDHPDVGFVFGDMLNVKQGSDWGSLQIYPPFRLSCIRRSAYLGQPTVFWRRSVFQEFGGFDDSLKFVADCDYWMRIGERYQAKKVNEVLAIERDHSDAKRFVQAEVLHLELNRVRSHYFRLEGFGYCVNVIVDRSYAFFWRRYYLLRFLYACLWARTLSGYRPSNAWACFTASKCFKISYFYALMTFVPFVGGKFFRSVVMANPALVR